MNKDANENFSKVLDPLDDFLREGGWGGGRHYRVTTPCLLHRTGTDLLTAGLHKHSESHYPLGAG